MNRNMWKHTFWHEHHKPAHSCSRIRVYIVHMKKLCTLGYPKCTQWRFWSDCTNAQADLNLHWAHMTEGTLSDIAAFFYSTGNIPIRWILKMKLKITVDTDQKQQNVIWSGSTMFTTWMHKHVVKWNCSNFRIRSTQGVLNITVTIADSFKTNQRLAFWVKFSADCISKYFSYFSQKTRFDISCKLSPTGFDISCKLSKKTWFDISCKLSPLETICMKCQILFSGKNKKNTNNLSSAHLVQQRSWSDCIAQQTVQDIYFQRMLWKHIFAWRSLICVSGKDHLMKKCNEMYVE